MGITHSLLRLSVGLEHSDDIMGDLQQAFAKVETHFAQSVPK
jgi:methionine-gamma-lyase